ncbi:MAG: methylmalonyl Co-A mutase-associated GTPase MeaB [Burkholderiaceae bacterium]|nr:methylmalonyl Co-A mutase-associated GTPase MeaB [Burkholderiaceae bacterium]
MTAARRIVPPASPASPAPRAPANEADALVAAVRAGDVRCCARLITRIERGEAALVEPLQALYRIGGRSRIVGVTGPPGAGKSTLVSQLVAVWRKRGLRVAVLAVDPSSPFSGGAVLGDRLRMMEHGCDSGVFIRSMASRGQLGGLAKAAGDALTVLDAMSWDIILIETVGVGQNETDVMRHASVVVLLQTPMGGDDVQAAKAGITEIGDIFVVNKADHPAADHTVRQLEEMIVMGLCLHPDKTWKPPVVKTRAIEGDGVAELADRIDERFAHLAQLPDAGRSQLRERARHRVAELLHHMVEQRLRPDDGLLSDESIDAVADRLSDPYALAASLLARMD